MGKGDRRSRRGKISAGTYGIARPKSRRKKSATKKPTAARGAVKKKPAVKK